MISENQLVVAVPSLRNCLEAARRTLEPWEDHKKTLFEGLKRKDFDVVQKATKSLTLCVTTVHQIFATNINSEKGKDWRADTKLVEATARLFHHRRRMQEFLEGMQFSNFLNTLSLVERVIKVILAVALKIYQGTLKTEEKATGKKKSTVPVEAGNYSDRWDDWKRWVKEYEVRGKGLPDDPSALVEMFKKEVE